MKGSTMGVALLAGLVAVASAWESGMSRFLTEKTFEHVTQASTGQTTGVWVIRFCSPVDAGCKELQNGWEELTEELLEHQIFLADVNVDRDPALATRFGVNHVPGFIMLKSQKMFRFPGRTTDRDDVYEWVMRDHQHHAPLRVPPESPDVQSQVADAVTAAKAKFATLLANSQSKESGKQPQALAILALPVLVICLVGVLMRLLAGPGVGAVKKRQ